MDSRKTVVVLAVVAVVVLIAQAVVLSVLQWGTRAEATRQAILLERATGILQGNAMNGENGGGAAVASALANTVAKLDELLSAVHNDSAVGIATGGSMVDAAVLLSTATDHQIRGSAAQILGRLGGEKAEKRLLELAHEDGQSAGYAIQGLRTMGSSKAADLVMDMLRNGTPEQMQNAANYLSGMMTKAMLPEVLEVMDGLPYGRNSRLSNVRRSLYGAIYEMGDPIALEPMLESIRNEMDDYGRQHAVRAFLACCTRADLHRAGAVLDILGPVGQNTNYSAHREVIQYLGQSGDFRATEHLMPLLDSPNPHVQQTALQAVCQLQDPLAAEKLLDCLKSGEQRLSQYAEQYVRNGYPGIEKRENEYVLVSREQMAQLLEQRNKAIASLEAHIDDAVEEGE